MSRRPVSRRSAPTRPRWPTAWQTPRGVTAHGRAADPAIPVVRAMVSRQRATTHSGSSQPPMDLGTRWAGSTGCARRKRRTGRRRPWRIGLAGSAAAEVRSLRRGVACASKEQPRRGRRRCFRLDGTDDPSGDTGDERALGDVLRDHGACGHHRVVADRDAPQDRRARGDPRAAADEYRSRRDLRAAGRRIKWVTGADQLHIRSHHHVVADGDAAKVHRGAAVVDEHVAAEAQVATGVGVERRKDANRGIELLAVSSLNNARTASKSPGASALSRPSTAHARRISARKAGPPTRAAWRPFAEVDGRRSGPDMHQLSRRRRTTRRVCSTSGARCVRAAQASAARSGGVAARDGGSVGPWPVSLSGSPCWGSASPFSTAVVTPPSPLRGGVRLLAPVGSRSISITGPKRRSTSSTASSRCGSTTTWRPIGGRLHRRAAGTAAHVLESQRGTCDLPDRDLARGLRALLSELAAGLQRVTTEDDTAALRQRLGTAYDISVEGPPPDRR